MPDNAGIEALRNTVNHANGVYDRWAAKVISGEFPKDEEFSKLMRLLKSDLADLQRIYGRPLMQGWHPSTPLGVISPEPPPPPPQQPRRRQRLELE